MKRVFRFLPVLLIVSLSASVRADETSTPSVGIGLALMHDTTLPGIPVAFRVTLKNLSNVPVDVPPYLRLRVEPVAGQAYFARTLDPHTVKATATVGGWPGREARVLGSKESVEVVFPVDTLLTGPEWFADPTLSRPGVYLLQLYAYSRLPRQDEPVSHITTADDASQTVVEPVVSNVVALTVRHPKGEDARVWEKMQELAGPDGWVPTMHLEKGLAEYVWRNHPSSYYLHYLTPMVKYTGEAEFIRAVKQALAIDPDGPNSESLKFVLAHLYTRLAEEAIYPERGGLMKAYEYAELAKSAYGELVADVKTREARIAAERGLAAVPDRAQLEALHDLAKKRKK